MPDPHDDHRLMAHDFDGIREYDNPLPGWWTHLFWITIVFSGLYMLYYHVGTGASVEASYQAEMAAFYERQLQVLGVERADTPTIVRLMHDEKMMAAVGGMFRGNCAQCHANDGRGNVGPNLTDDHWKNVKTPEDIFTVIRDGVPGTQMTAWSNRMREPQMILLAAYVAWLRSTDPPDGRTPEGQVIPPWPPLPGVAGAGELEGDPEGDRADGAAGVTAEGEGF